MWKVPNENGHPGFTKTPAKRAVEAKDFIKLACHGFGLWQLGDLVGHFELQSEEPKVEAGQRKVNVARTSTLDCKMLKSHSQEGQAELSQRGHFSAVFGGSFHPFKS